MLHFFRDFNKRKRYDENLIVSSVKAISVTYLFCIISSSVYYEYESS